MEERKEGIGLPAAVWCEHVLPFLADRQTWNAMACTNKEIYQGSKAVLLKYLQEGRVDRFPWLAGTISSPSSQRTQADRTVLMSWTSIAFSKPKGTFLFAASECGRLVVWHQLMGDLGCLPDQYSRINALASSPVDEGLVAGCVTTQNGEFGVALWKIGCKYENGALFQPLPSRLLFGQSDEVLSLAFQQHTGKLLASGSADHSIRIWNVQTGESLAVLQNTSIREPIYQVSLHTPFIQEGDGLLDTVVEGALGTQGSVQCLATGEAMFDTITEPTFSFCRWSHPNQFRKAIGSENGKIYITYANQRGRTQCSFGTGVIRKVSTCRFLPSPRPRSCESDPRADLPSESLKDGLVAIADGYSSLRIWDVTAVVSTRDTLPLCRLRGHGAQVKDFDISGRFLTSAAADGSIRIWDLYHLPPFEGPNQRR